MAETLAEDGFGSTDNLISGLFKGVTGEGIILRILCVSDGRGGLNEGGSDSK